MCTLPDLFLALRALECVLLCSSRLVFSSVCPAAGLGFKESRVMLLGMASFMCCASLVALTQCWQSRGKEGTHSVPFLHVPIFLPFSSLLQRATSQHSFPLASCLKLELSFPPNNPLHYLYYTMNQFSLYYWKSCMVLISKQISYGTRIGFVGTCCFQDVLGVIKCARLQGIYVSSRASLLHKNSLNTYRVPNRTFAEKKWKMSCFEVEQ